MNDDREPLSTLQNDIKRDAVKYIESQARRIFTCTNVYVPEMDANTTDEFLLHAGTIRRMAGTLMEECAKVSDDDEILLTRIKEQFEELKGFVEYWCSLRQPDLADSLHFAL